MKSLFNNSVRSEIRERLTKLTPECKSKWGKFTPETMTAHMIDALANSFGERQAEVKKGFLSSRLGQWLIIDSPMPWPKGVPTAPEFLKSPPTDLERDKARVLEYLDRFGKGRDQKWGVSPAFRNLTPDQWSRLQYRHLNHHLTQFGL
jgi:hypothetical protein